MSPKASRFLRNAHGELSNLAPKLEPLESRLLLDGSAPIFATPLTDQWFGSGGGLTIGVDGADDDGDALTVSVNSDAAGLDWHIPSGNRFARLNFVESDGTTIIGDVVVELFETRGSTATERFITLATNHVNTDGTLDPSGVPFYTDVVVHRVIPGFMIQTGDAQRGNGSGQSPLGAFDDVFDPDLAFYGAGVLAMANSGPNTNDCQFFITDGAAPWLNQVHMIFGQVISGHDVVDTIINLETDQNDRPLDPPLLASVDIFESDQDATITFTAVDGWTGEANVTITLDDGNGNQTSETITITSLGEQPAIGDPGTLFGTAEQTLSFTADIVDDGGLPLDLSISGSHGATYSVDSDTAEVEITPPADFTGMLAVTLSAAEAGYDGRSPATREFHVLVQNPGDDVVALGRAAIDPETWAIDAFLSGDRLFAACAEGGLVVYDVSDPANPTQLGTYTDPDVVTSFRDVEVIGDVAFVTNTDGGLVSLDVTDPTDIRLLDQSTDMTFAISIAVIGDVAFITEYIGGLGAYDISDPSNITQLDSVQELPGGVALAQTVGLAVKGHYVYVSDTGEPGPVAVFDASDPTDLEFEDGFATGGSPRPVRIALAGGRAQRDRHRVGQ